MPRSILKSAVHAASRQRFVLHAIFSEDEVLQEYRVTIQSEYDPHGTCDPIEHAEHFIVTPSCSPSMRYNAAAARFRELVLPTL